MNSSINLLPPEYLPRRRLTGQVITALVAGGLILVVYLIFLLQWGLAARQAASLEEQLALYLPRSQAAAADRAAIDKWRRQEDELQRLVKERRRWQPLLSAINDALPREAWLNRLEEIEGGSGLILAGESTSLEVVGDFIAALQGSGFWQVVNLLEVKGSDKGLAFTIQAVFKDAPPAAGEQAP